MKTSDAEFAVNMTTGLVKLRKAYDTEEGCTLTPGETKAVVESLRMLNTERKKM